MPARILVVDDERSLREMLSVLLRRSGHVVTVAEGQTAAATELAQDPPFDLVITDLSMPDGSGMGVLNAARARDEATQVIMITAYATTAQAVEAMRQGAYDYIQKPFKNNELIAVVEKALEKRAIVDQNRQLRRRVAEGFRAGDLVGKSTPMQQVMEMVRRVASAPTSVLITGESGTGKELVARALHREGERRDRAFVAINCAAMPEQLLESELFGHAKGAFTGATSVKEGLFRAADKGTLFLDEVGELPLALQVKLLRALQERKVRAVGAEVETTIDVRVVAATNRELEAEVTQNRFRSDLFYRLNVIRIHLPPLRERREDIPLLAQHFLDKHAAAQNKRLTFSTPAMASLARRTFPGNVRELENMVERAVTLALGREIELSDLPEETPSDTANHPAPSLPEPAEGFDLDGYLGDVERKILLAALDKAGGVRKSAAKLLGMSFRSMRYRLAKFGLEDDEEEISDDT